MLWHMDAFLNIGIAIGITVVITYVIRLLKQPLIIGYIFSWIVLWPYLLNFLAHGEVFEAFSQIGISLLLFIVWIGLNAKMIKETGKASLITGLGQVLFTSIIGFGISMLLGFAPLESLYICIALTFSSTIIIMKILSDKWDMGAMYGKIAMGFLIVQDIVAAILLMVISSLGMGDSNMRSTLWIGMLKWALLITTAVLVWIYVLPRFVRNIAKSQEFLLLFSIAWCIIVAGLFHYFWFSMEIWALVAGITLSFSPMRFEIAAKMKTLRDFFLVIFFIILGSQMWFISSSQHLITIIVMSLFILIGNPLIVLFLMGRMWYDARSGFMAGLTVAQISEFSIILIVLGIKTGHLSSDILSIVVTIGLITIIGSTYMIMYSDKLYSILKPYIKRFERCVDKQHHEIAINTKEGEIIVFGCHRMWADLLQYTNKIKQDLLIIDYNPMTVKTLQDQNYNAIYGDLQDAEFLWDLDMSNTKMIISTVPDFEANALLIKTVKEHKKIHPIIITTSHQITEALDLYTLWSTYVITPYFLGGHYISKLIEEHGLQRDKFVTEAEQHKRCLLKDI